MRVAVIGASGYTGLELIRILSRHPQFEISVATSEQRAGQAVGAAFPSLGGILDLDFEANDPERVAQRVDFAFTALPHGASAPAVASLRKAGVPVADLSADFRIRDVGTYEASYGSHGAPEWLDSAVYGLPELYRESLAATDLAAVAGCYPTSVLLPLVPLLRAGMLEPGHLMVDSKSGVSGAGRKLEADYLFAELEGDCRAYQVGGVHRHVPEMEQEAGAAAGAAACITFVPHLLPTTRGIATSIYARPVGGLSAARAREVLLDAYAQERFVRVLPEGQAPRLSSVKGSNYCDVAAFADERTGTLILLSTLDNLVKGAAGQAVQCANLMCGFPEDQGLLEVPIAP
ncbi:N-acetyl-gamma-glutamyl-phosphate reductase [Myxococcota bacterium]|nr:N-acetyl-gamma-glutamyl-phosphate reductase [Myxococcota bacterium]